MRIASLTDGRHGSLIPYSNSASNGLLCSGCTFMNAMYCKALVQSLLLKLDIVLQYSVPVASLSGWWSASTYMGVHVGISTKRLTVLVKLVATVLHWGLVYEEHCWVFN